MNQDRIWDYFQNDAAGLAAFQMALPRYRFVAHALPAAGRVLNIGVGSGGLETLLLNSGRDVCCLDPSEKAIESMRQRLRLSSAQARVGYSQNIPFDAGSFDVVVMSEVLEHLDDTVLAATLVEVRRVLRPNGIFLGTVPANEVLSAEYAVCPDCGKVFHRWGHVQSFTSARMDSLLRGGFSKVRVDEVLFGMGEQLNWKGRLGWYLSRGLLALGVAGQAKNLFFRATVP
jgi:SAM-dependent methyltransferase